MGGAEDVRRVRKIPQGRRRNQRESIESSFPGMHGRVGGWLGCRGEAGSQAGGWAHFCHVFFYRHVTHSQSWQGGVLERIERHLAFPCGRGFAPLPGSFFAEVFLSLFELSYWASPGWSLCCVCAVIMYVCCNGMEPLALFCYLSLPICLMGYLSRNRRSCAGSRSNTGSCAARPRSW